MTATRTAATLLMEEPFHLESASSPIETESWSNVRSEDTGVEAELFFDWVTP